MYRRILLIFFSGIVFCWSEGLGQGSRPKAAKLSDLQKSRFVYSSILSKEEILIGETITITNQVKKKALNVAGKEVLVRIIPPHENETLARNNNYFKLPPDNPLDSPNTQATKTEITENQKEAGFKNLFIGTTDLKGEFIVHFPFTDQAGLYQVETIFLANDRNYQEHIIINKFLVADIKRGKIIFSFLGISFFVLSILLFWLFLSNYKNSELIYYSPLFYLLAWNQSTWLSSLSPTEKKLDFSFIFLSQTLLLLFGSFLLWWDQLYFFIYYLMGLLIFFFYPRLLPNHRPSLRFLPSLFIKLIFIYLFIGWLDEATPSVFFIKWWEANYSTEQLSLIYLSPLLPFPLLFFNLAGLAFFYDAFLLKEILLITVLSTFPLGGVMLWYLVVYTKKRLL